MNIYYYTYLQATYNLNVNELKILPENTKKKNKH